MLPIIERNPVLKDGCYSQPNTSFRSSSFTLILQRFCHSLENLNNKRKDLQNRVIQWLKDKITAAVKIFSCIFTFSSSPQRKNSLTQSEPDPIKKNPAVENEKSPPMPVKPLGLPNVGNACYMNAALEALFCFEETRKKLHQDLEPESIPTLKTDANEAEKKCYESRIQQAQIKLANRKKLQQHLIDVIDAPTTNGFTNWNDFLNSMSSHPIRELRDCFFETDLGSLNDAGKKDNTANSPDVMRIIINQILDGYFQKESYTTNEIPGRIFYLPVEKNDLLTLPTFGERSLSLQNMIDQFFSTTTIDNTVFGMRFTPKKGIISDAIKAQTLTTPENQSLFPASCERFIRFKNLPEFMVLNLERASMDKEGILRKINTPVHLPSNLILNLKKAVDEVNQDEAIYEILSTVNLTGAVEGGHFTSHVRIGDKFFHTDDAHFHEISQDDFVNQTDINLVIIRRVKNK